MKLTRSLALCVGLLLSLGAQAQSRGLIDTHMHFQVAAQRDLPGSARMAVEIMDRFGIGRSLLMPPPIADSSQRNFHDIEDLRFVMAAHPGRFALLGGSRLNAMIHQTPAEAVTAELRAAFAARVREYLALGAVGFGEIAIHHVSIPAMGPNHAYELVPADHPLLLLLVDLAAEAGVPVDLHFDLVPEDMPLPAVLQANKLNPPVLKANMESFRRLLGHNPKARLVWSHVGFEPLLTREPGLVRELMQKFPNLYMSFRLNRGAPSPAAALSPSGSLKQPWARLIQDFGERFLLGSDSFYAADGIARGSGEEGLQRLQELVAQLPEPVRSQVARGNAVKLYRLAEE